VQVVFVYVFCSWLIRAARLCLPIEISSFHPHLLNQPTQPNPTHPICKSQGQKHETPPSASPSRAPINTASPRQQNPRALSHIYQSNPIQSNPIQSNPIPPGSQVHPSSSPTKHNPISLYPQLYTLSTLPPSRTIPTQRTRPSRTPLPSFVSVYLPVQFSHCASQHPRRACACACVRVAGAGEGTMQGYAGDRGSLWSRIEGVRRREREREDGQGHISRRSCIKAAGASASQVYVSVNTADTPTSTLVDT
jgi:hypothetical protein